MEEFWQLILISSTLSGDITLKQLIRSLPAEPELRPKSPNYKCNVLITSPPCNTCVSKRWSPGFPTIHNANINSTWTFSQCSVKKMDVFSLKMARNKMLKICNFMLCMTGTNFLSMAVCRLQVPNPSRTLQSHNLMKSRDLTYYSK